jgi:signal transduction histidine kinase
MNAWKWNPLRVLLNVPIFYKVIVANSASALVVICTLVLFREARVAAAGVVLACGLINALLVRTAFAVEAHRRQQRELFAWTLRESEKERGRVASAIHDDVAQRLAALLLHMSADRDVSRETARAMQDLCDTAETLRPGRLALLGLKGALTWLVQDVRRRAGVPVDLTADEGCEQLDQELALQLYRLIEDTITTLALPAPDRIDVRIAYTGATVATSVCGHARGSDASEPLARTDEFRLTERAACLGGTAAFGRRGDSFEAYYVIPTRESHERHDSRLAG